MMRLATWIGSSAVALAVTAGAQTPATQPAAALPPVPASAAPGGGQSTEKLEAAASAAFEANDYASALPLLKDLSVRVRDQPDKVAPLLEKIRVCEKSVAAAQATVVEGINAPRTPHPAPVDGQVYAVALQKLGNFNFDGEKGGNIPADVTALSGSTVKLNGFMIPIDQSEKITKFVLVPSLFACCFGQPPSIQHTVMVATPPGKAISYYAEQIDVTGKLTVQERKEDGFILSIFEMEASSIRPSATP